MISRQEAVGSNSVLAIVRTRWEPTTAHCLLLLAYCLLMLKAIIFDCDGVIADSEPLHFAALQGVLAEAGITLTEETYYREYLAFDDRGCFNKAFHGHGQPLTDDKLRQLIARKAAQLEPVMRTHLRIFPGVAELIRRASAK